MGDGFGPKANINHQPYFDESPATNHGGGVNIVTEQVINPGYTNSGEELLQTTQPELNALNKERNSIQKPPTTHNYHTDHNMQLIGDDSDITNTKLGGNVSDVTTQNLRSPTHAELNSVISGGIT